MEHATTPLSQISDLEKKWPLFPPRVAAAMEVLTDVTLEQIVALGKPSDELMESWIVFNISVMNPQGLDKIAQQLWSILDKQQNENLWPGFREDHFSHLYAAALAVAGEPFIEPDDSTKFKAWKRADYNNMVAALPILKNN